MKGKSFSPINQSDTATYGNTDEKITVPAGTFRTLHLTSPFKTPGINGVNSEAWFSSSAGSSTVKSSIYSIAFSITGKKEQRTIIIELKSIEKKQ